MSYGRYILNSFEYFKDLFLLIKYVFSIVEYFHFHLLNISCFHRSSVCFNWRFISFLINGNIMCLQNISLVSYLVVMFAKQTIQFFLCTNFLVKFWKIIFPSADVISTNVITFSYSLQCMIFLNSIVICLASNKNCIWKIPPSRWSSNYGSGSYSLSQWFFMKTKEIRYLYWS